MLPLRTGLLKNSKRQIPNAKNQRAPGADVFGVRTIGLRSFLHLIRGRRPLPTLVTGHWSLVTARTRHLRPALALVIGHWSLAISALVIPCVSSAAAFDLGTATVEDLQLAMEKGTLTSEKLVTLYLARIEAYDKKGPKLNSIITLNPRALDEARALDAERKAKGPRSPLHGIVVLAKDVYDTADMPTSGGFKPMVTSQPARDSFVIARLRKAGAIILAKLNQSDWYGVPEVRSASTAIGPVTSPYNAKKSAGGSSSGTGVSMAAWLGTVGLGSDTSGSIVIPTQRNGLVGFSTTLGLVSRTGMMWSSPSQESGGPMGRSVYDCAAVLDAIAGYDPADLVTQAGVGKIPDRPYVSFVSKSKDGLKGARLGVLRERFRSGPRHEEGNALAEKAFADLKAAGAILIDPVLTGLKLTDPEVIMSADASNYERGAAINKYLAGLPPTAPIRSVAEMIAKSGSTTVKPVIIESAKIGSLDHYLPFLAALKQQQVLRSALLEVIEKYQLDAIVLPYETKLIEDVPVPGTTPTDIERNALASFTGYPTILVPGGFYASDGMPFAMQFIGRPFSEPTLITLASSYEAATKHRKAPVSTPALPGEAISY